MPDSAAEGFDGAPGTPQELSTWLYSIGERRRINYAERILDAIDTAARCERENHAGYAAELESLRSVMVDAIRAVGKGPVSSDEAIAARLVKRMVELDMARPAPVTDPSL